MERDAWKNIYKILNDAKEKKDLALAQMQTDPLPAGLVPGGIATNAMEED